MLIYVVLLIFTFNFKHLAHHGFFCCYDSLLLPAISLSPAFIYFLFLMNLHAVCGRRRDLRPFFCCWNFRHIDTVWGSNYRLTQCSHCELHRTVIIFFICLLDFFFQSTCSSNTGRLSSRLHRVLAGLHKCPQLCRTNVEHCFSVNELVACNDSAIGANSLNGVKYWWQCPSCCWNWPLLWLSSATIVIIITIDEQCMAFE